MTEMQDSALGENLALGKPAVASSVHSDNYSADKAVDGNPSTRWAMKDGVSAPQNLVIDLGVAVPFNSIRISEWVNDVYPDHIITSFDINVSDDSTNWDLVYRGSTVPKGPFVTKLAIARYIQLNITGMLRTASVYEFEVFYSDSSGVEGDYNAVRDICAGTPVVTVVDSLGQPVRTLNYNRTAAGQALDELITRTVFDVRGQVDTVTDPRFFTAWQNGGTVSNAQYRHSLEGNLLRQDSVDAGSSLSLADCAGNAVWSRSANQVETEMEYDQLGRITATFETAGGKRTCRERFVYGESVSGAADYNLRGQPVYHYDTAGLVHLQSAALGGDILQQSRRLLKDLEAGPDWQGASQGAWDALLETAAYVHAAEYNAGGQLLAETDAKGNRQAHTYNQSGLETRASLSVRGGPEITVLTDVEYDVLGQPVSAAIGNGVRVESEYDEDNHRLVRQKTWRAGSLVQDTAYTYDPVGNILRREDLADTARVFRSQVTEPASTYHYDALYQLLSATGREQDSLRGGTTVLDGTQLVGYTRSYRYDRGGNLLRIRHQGASAFTRDITVSEKSNRGIWLEGDKKPADVDSYFNPAGCQAQLGNGRSLVWNGLNQLARVDAVARDNGDNDTETYFYGGDRQRIVKRTVRKTASSTQEDRVVYLPGVELRERKTGDKVTETLQVISFGSGQVLHWEDGTQPEGAGNDWVQYDFADQVDSVTLQLDGEGQVISREEYYPYGGTAVWTARSQVEADRKYTRYSGQEKDATGLYYYGFRYYMPSIGRWTSADPAGMEDGTNLYAMVGNNPVSDQDDMGLAKYKRPRLGPLPRETSLGLHREHKDILRERGAHAAEEFRKQTVRRLADEAFEKYKQLETGLFEQALQKITDEGERNRQRDATHKLLSELQSIGGTDKWFKSGEPVTVPQFWLGYNFGSKDKAQEHGASAKYTDRGIESNTIEGTVAGNILDMFIPYPVLSRSFTPDQSPAETVKRRSGKKYALTEIDKIIAEYRKENNNEAAERVAGFQDYLVNLFESGQPFVGGAGAAYIWNILSAQFAKNTVVEAAFTAPENINRLAGVQNKAWSAVEYPFLRYAGAITGRQSFIKIVPNSFEAQRYATRRTKRTRKAYRTAPYPQ